MTRCMGCMEEIPENEAVCPHCGYRKGTDVKEAYYLLPGTKLGGKYIVGRVLGYGGFGVTYIGWDVMLHRKTAVKEYLPSDFATRSYGTTQLTVFTGEAAQQFAAGLDSFIKEAKRMAKFNNVAQIADIYDCFKENGSGYIIMEYVDGSNLKILLKNKKTFPVDQAKHIVMEVLKGLEAVHKEGIVHRDIAPDNIMLTRAGEVKIIDFGASRYATAVQSRSLSIILKPGYAPPEQYYTRGNQGPWTDVYALAATFYRMITGVRPQISIERAAEDHLKPPSALGVQIDKDTENAIMNSLNISLDYRTKDAAGFYKQLSQGSVSRVVEKKTAKVELKLPLWVKCSVAAACVLAIACIGMYATGNISFTKKQIESASGTAALSSGERYVPNVSGLSYEDAEVLLQKKKLNVVINGMNYSDSIEKNKILSQNPQDGAKAAEEETVYVVMSGGSEEVMMPDLSGMKPKEAQQLLKAQNIVIKSGGVTEEYNDIVEKGRIISQSVKAEKRIAVKTKVSYTVSLGRLSEETAVLKVPDLTGSTKEAAIKKLEKLKDREGFTYSLGEVKSRHSGKIAKGKIISQSLEAGSRVRTNEPIDIVISKGPQMVEVPEVRYITQAEAEAKLKQAGLNAAVSSEYSSQVSEGLVIRQDSEAGSQAAKGSGVSIVISRGPEPVQQPQQSQTQQNQTQQQPQQNQTQQQPQQNQTQQQPQQQPQQNQTQQPQQNPDGGRTFTLPSGGTVTVQ